MACETAALAAPPNKMQGYNLIAVISPDKDRILMLLRQRDPYKGLYNLPGGKIEPEETGEDAAYRELFEETGIDRRDIRLLHLMDFTYPLDPCYVEVYAGMLKDEVELIEEEHPLAWMLLSEDFFSLRKYAGEGNIGHIVEHIRLNWERIKSL